MKHHLLVLSLGWILAALSASAWAGDQNTPEPGGDKPPTIFDVMKTKDHGRLIDFLESHKDCVGDRAPSSLEYPLHQAIDSGNADAIALLIQYGANVDAIDGKNTSPLILAAKKQNFTTAELLLKNKANVDKQDINGWSALHFAVLAKNTPLIDLLCAHKASIDLIEPQKALNPVHLAITLGREDLAIRIIATQFDNPALALFKNLHAGNTEAFTRELDAHPERLTLNLAGGWTLLHQAVVDRRMDEMRYLLDHELSTFMRDAAKRTALHYAAQNGNLEFVQRLLEYKAEVNVGDESRITPLALAVRNNHLKICQLLLGNHANPNITDSDGKNLAFALIDCDDAMAELLLNHKIHLNGRDSQGCTVLYYLLDKPQRAELLISKGAAVNPKDKNGRTLLHIAAEVGDPKMVNLLIDRGVPLEEIDRKKRTALHLAALKGNAAAVNALLAHDADVNAEDATGATPLHFAVYNPHSLAAMLQRHPRVDPVDRNDGMTPLAVAEQAGQKDSKFLLQIHLDTLAAAKAGDLAALKKVFTDLTATQDKLRTDGNKELADLLATAPSTMISARDRDGLTPLLLAAQGGHLELLRYLLQCGGDPAAVTRKGLSAVHLAAASNHGPVIALLLQKGAEVNLADATGCTPLHLAAANNALNAIPVLLAAKASLEAVNQKGDTALQMAQAAKLAEAAALLEAAASKPNR